MNHRFQFGLLFVLAATLGCAQAAPQMVPGRYPQTVTNGTMQRKFTLTVPKGYDGTKSVPLVVLLHGWGSNSSQIEDYTGFGAKAQSEGFILATPDGLGQTPGWNVGYLDLSGQKQDDAALVGAIIDKVQGEVTVDAKRIFVVGHSNGAMLANLVGARFSGKVAAIGSVAGTIGLPTGPNRLIPDPTQPISVILVHGTADKMVAYDSAAQSLLKSVGALESAKWWAKADGISVEPAKMDFDGGKAKLQLFKGGKQGTEVELVTVPNGSHDWPGTSRNMSVNATNIIWDFFKAHPKA
ncbi:hypothetical protein BH11ARM1_BH11ARM1_08140 [soil metagenome]